MKTNANFNFVKTYAAIGIMLETFGSCSIKLGCLGLLLFNHCYLTKEHFTHLPYLFLLLILVSTVQYFVTLFILLLSTYLFFGMNLLESNSILLLYSNFGLLLVFL